MDHKKWKNIGWKLVLSAAFRKWYQETEDFQEKQIADLKAEIEELREKDRDWWKRFETYQKNDQEHETWLKQQFTNEMNQFDVTKVMPHLSYLKGLHYTPEQFIDVYPTAIIRAHISRHIPYPEKHVQQIIRQVENHMEEIPPCLIDYHVKKYFCNDEDMVIASVDHWAISAGVYNNRESYEAAKAEKSREMDKLLDEISK